MDFGFLNLLYNFRYEDNSGFLNRKVSKEEKYFYEKYIQRACDNNLKYGLKMEEDYHAALGGISQREFITGFRIGLYFLLECLSAGKFYIES